MNRHVSVFFTAQFLALPEEITGFFGTEPSVTHKTWNGILLDAKGIDCKGVNHVVRGGDDAYLLVDRHHQGVVDLEQVVVGRFWIAAVGHFALGVVQGGDKANAFSFTFDVVITPFPLIARGLDGQVGVGSVFAGHHRFGCGQGHQNHNNKRHHSPSNFNFERLVECGRFVSSRFAVLPNGIKHDAKHSHKNHRTDDQHEPVQPNLLFSNFGHGWVQVQLTYCGAAG